MYRITLLRPDLNRGVKSASRLNFVFNCAA